MKTNGFGKQKTAEELVDLTEKTKALLSVNNMTLLEVTTLLKCSRVTLLRAFAVIGEPSPFKKRKLSLKRQTALDKIEIQRKFKPLDTSKHNNEESLSELIRENVLKITTEYSTASLATSANALFITQSAIRKAFKEQPALWPFKNSSIKPTKPKTRTDRNPKPVVIDVLSTDIKSKDRDDWIYIQKAIMGVAAKHDAEIILAWIKNSVTQVVCHGAYEDFGHFIIDEDLISLAEKQLREQVKE